MNDYERTARVDASADALFAYLSDVDNLPDYFERMTEAEPGNGQEVHTKARIDTDGQGEQEVEGEAWFKVDEEGRRIQWGSEGPNNYSGELEVSANGEGSEVAVRLRTEMDDEKAIEGDLQRTLDNIKRLVEDGAGA